MRFLIVVISLFQMLMLFGCASDQRDHAGDNDAVMQNPGDENFGTEYFVEQTCDGGSDGVELTDVCDGGTECSSQDVLCLDECSDSRQTRCKDNHPEECGDANNDGCLEWVPKEPCTEGFVCDAGDCVRSCVHECEVPFSLRCYENTVQSCEDVDGDSCFEWSLFKECRDFETCINGGCEHLEPPAQIVISELLYDSEGIDKDTFIELHGPPETNLAQWSLVGINGRDGNIYLQLPLAGAIWHDGLFLIVHPDANDRLHRLGDMQNEGANLQNGPDSLQLLYGEIVVDAVGYGQFGDADSFAGEGAFAEDAGAGKSLTRDCLHNDTGDNRVDFTVSVEPSPGWVRSCSEIIEEDEPMI